MRITGDNQVSLVPSSSTRTRFFASTSDELWNQKSRPKTENYIFASAAFDSEISSGNEKKWQLVTVKNLFRGSIGQGRTTLMICGLLIEKLLLLFEPKSLQIKVEKSQFTEKILFLFYFDIVQSLLR